MINENLMTKVMGEVKAGREENYSTYWWEIILLVFGEGHKYLREDRRGRI